MALPRVLLHEERDPDGGALTRASTPAEQPTLIHYRPARHSQRHRPGAEVARSIHTEIEARRVLTARRQGGHRSE